MADRLVHLTGVNKREVEAALGYELTPVSPAGDMFRVPEEVAVRIAELPPSPPKAEDSFRAKEAARALPFSDEDLEDLEPVSPAPSKSEVARAEKSEDEDKPEGEPLAAEDVVGPGADADR